MRFTSLTFMSALRTSAQTRINTQVDKIKARVFNTIIKKS